MTTTAIEILEQLTGRWKIERRIENEDASFEGEALFSKIEEKTCLYRETGILRLSNGSEIEAYRSYVYRATDTRLLVEFGDGPDKGKRFVALEFQTENDSLLSAKDTHRCGDDVYLVDYRLSLPASLATKISVSGPRKDYCAHSTYSRV